MRRGRHTFRPGMVMPEIAEPFILLIEDNKPDVYLVRKSLQEHRISHELRVVRDGEEALRFIAEIGGANPCPALVLLYLNLPRVDGREILYRLRANPQASPVPVIAMSSSDSPADRTAIIQLGARAYFRKPPDLDQFMRLGRVVTEVLAEAPEQRTSRGTLGV